MEGSVSFAALTEGNASWPYACSLWPGRLDPIEQLYTVHGNGNNRTQHQPDNIAIAGEHTPPVRPGEPDADRDHDPASLDGHPVAYRHRAISHAHTSCPANPASSQYGVGRRLGRAHRLA